MILDGETIYDASEYVQQAQASGTAPQIGAQGVASAADGFSDIDYSALEKYDQRTYTNRGWVVVNKVLTGKELKKFNSQWTDAQKHKFKYPKSSNGNIIITVGDTYASADTLVYTNGTFENPIITKVVKIVPKDPSDVSYLREEIVMGEDSGNEYIWAIVKSLAGEESFIFYTPQDFGTYSELTNAKTERQGLQNSNGDSDGEPSGGGNGAPHLGENQGAVNNSTDTISSLPPSDGGTGSFADAKNPTVDGDLGIIGVRASTLDRAFMDMSEEERSSLIAAFEKNTGTRVVFDETIGADGKYENGVIYVNPNTATPMTVIKHELTHYLEKSGSYNDFMNFVFGSQAFAEWLRSKGQTQSEMRKEIIDRYAAAGKPLGQHGVDAGFEANQEILANFVGEKLFRDVNALAELAQKNRKWYQVLWDFVKGLFTKYQGTPIERELRKMEQMFAKAVQQKRSDSTADDTGSKYLITEDGSKVDISKLTEANVREMLQNAADGIYYDNSYIPLRRNTPVALIEAARSRGDIIENLPVIMSVKKARQAMEIGEAEGETDRPHNLSEDDMIAIVKAMDEPEHIVFQGSNERYIEIVRYRTGKGGVAIAVIEIGENKMPHILTAIKRALFKCW